MPRTDSLNPARPRREPSPDQLLTIATEARNLFHGICETVPIAGRPAPYADPGTYADCLLFLPMLKLRRILLFEAPMPWNTGPGSPHGLAGWPLTVPHALEQIMFALERIMRRLGVREEIRPDGTIALEDNGPPYLPVDPRDLAILDGAAKRLGTEAEAALEQLGALTISPPAAGEVATSPRLDRPEAPSEPAPRLEDLPALLSAPDLARRLGLPGPRLESRLRRYRASHPDCCTEAENPRRNEPRILYRVADVWPVVQAMLTGG